MTSVSLWLIAAMLVLGALALTLLGYLSTIRIPLVTGGKVKLRDVALSRDSWPEREKQVSNAIDNQFQLPVLFYVACLLSLQLGTTLLDVLLAWAFVLTRLVHAWIFVTTNDVVQRFTAYSVGFLIMCLIWIVLIVRLILVAVAGS